MTTIASEVGLQVESLNLTLQQGGRPVQILDDVSLRVRPGQALGVVGESGSGKTMTALCIAGLVARFGGTMSARRMDLDGRDLSALSGREWERVRGRSIAFMPQQPSRSLNPAFRVGEQIAEVSRRHHGTSRRVAWREAVDLLERVGIDDPAVRARQYPHQFSGGMAQRVSLAIALAGRPSVLIADEPTSALDVTVQKQILDLLSDVRRDTNVAMIVITHDIGVVAVGCDDLAVMYAGQVVEEGPVWDVLMGPRHPYTAGLLAAIPRLGFRDLKAIPGTVPPPADWRDGCRFLDRCAAAQPQCNLSSTDLDGYFVRSGSRCVRVDEISLDGLR